MQSDEYIQANHKAWNETETFHRKASFEKLKNVFLESGSSVLDRVAAEILEGIFIQGKNVIQLCCNNGRELLSIKNMGAARCVGFDLSDAFISQAKELVQISGINCEFYQGDANQVPPEFYAKFDLVFISVGTLGWMPELKNFLSQIKKLLVPGGKVFIYEMHPILDMFEEKNDNAPAPPLLKYSYFKETPFVEESGLDYLGKTTYQSLPTYWFHHKLSDIIQGCLINGLIIEDFQEYEHDVSATFSWLEDITIRPPLSYTLVARS